MTLRSVRISRICAATGTGAVAAVVMALLSPSPAQALQSRHVGPPPLPPTPAVQGVAAVRPHVVVPPDTAGRNAAPARSALPQAGPAAAGLVTVRDHSGAVPAHAVVAGSEQAIALGVHGVVLTVTPDAAVPPGASVSVDYSGFAQAEGGNFGSRLRLAQLPACALSTPAVPACRRATALPSRNDTAAMRVSAPMPSATAVLALAAATAAGDGGSGGDYGATSLKPSGSWSAGGSTGSFTYSYPIALPPAPGGLAPDLSLGYDSGSVDGQTASTNAQSSWIGDGWASPESFVEQSFASCKDSPEGSAAPVSTPDNCYDGPIVSLSLKGSTTSLVYDSGSSTWKVRNDPTAVVKRVTGSNNGSGTHDTDYWTVTTGDGTVYSFGRNHLPGWSSGKAATNSVQSEPVFSAHSGDPCYSSTWSNSVCTMAYRWNLDYVTNVHGAATAYYYTQATNFYGQNKGATNASYVRDAYLSHIDYGFGDGNAYGTVPDKVVFTIGDRCLSGTCQPLNSTNAKNWPDVPFSQICASGATCTMWSPTFFSTVRLTKIETQQYATASSSYVTVDAYALAQTMPATGDATSPTLWLSSITRTGSDTTAGGSSSPITLPSVSFTGIDLQNRVDTTTVALPAFYRYRIGSVTTDSGSVIGVSYDLPNACASPVSVTVSSNTSSCYPVKWTPDGYTTPITDWFNKYAVTKVTESDPTGGGTTTATSYAYQGGAAWHFDDNEVVKAKYRTYGQFRGYGDVQTFAGDGVNDSQTEAESTYYRGMSKNNSTTAVNVSDSQGGTHEDVDQLAGRTLESTTYKGKGGAVDSSKITSYWVSAAAASRTRSGLSTLTANAVAPVEVWTRQAVTSGSSTTWRVTETDTAYDASTSSTTFAQPRFVYSHTSPVNSAYDSCTATTYAPVSTSVNLRNLVAQTETDSVACSGWTAGSPASVPGSVNALGAPASVSRPNQVISAERTFYDDETFATTFPQGSAPSKGDVTMTQEASGYTGSTFTWQTTARHTHDGLGRPLKDYDANGNLATSSYTSNTAGLLTGTATTNPLGQSSSLTIDPERGLTLTATDPNGLVTTVRSDALGRTTAVWRFSRATTSSANETYTYVLSRTGISSVTTNVLNDEGNVVTSTLLYDGMLRPRQTQTSTPQSGRLVTDTFYDSRGWVSKKYNGWWDSATTPNTTLVSAADLKDAVPNADVYTYDGVGRSVLDTSTRNGVTVSTATTVYGGDRVTRIPPAGGTATVEVLDPLGRDSELDTYSSAPTVTAPSNTFTGNFTVSGGATVRTSYGYDGHGHENTVTDAAGHVWTTTFDLRGRAVTKTDPDAGTTQLGYDANGNLLQTTDARGASVSLTYDALNRKTARYTATTANQSSGTKVAAWVYDNSDNAVTGMKYPLGHLTSSTSYSGGNAYVDQATGFTVFGKALGEKVTVPSAEGALAGTYTFNHTYSTTTGLLLKDVFPAAGGLPAETVSHGYAGALDLPATLGGTNGYAQSVTHDAFGRVNQETLGAAGTANQAYLTNTYDDHTGRLMNQLVTRSTATPSSVDEQAYTYDPAGNVTRQVSTRVGATSTSETQCYRYDPLDRLTSAWTANDACAVTPASGSSGTVADALSAASAYWTTWTFDTQGNRTGQTVHGLAGASDTTTSYTYNAGRTSGGQPDTLTGTQNAGASTTSTGYGYDAAGNMTSRNAGQGAQTLAWTDDDELTSISAGSTVTSFVYDADGTLLVQHEPGSTTLYLPGEQLTLTTATSTVAGVRYYPLPGGGAAYRTGSGASDYGFELGDHHGSGVLRLDATAQTPTWRQFTPYGAARGATATWFDNRGFLGGPASPTTGLSVVGARSYDTQTGRFVSVDPVLESGDPQQLNGYAYAKDNPVTFSDQKGLEAGSWCETDACATLNAQSQTSYPMDTMVHGVTHARPAPNIGPDVYASAVIKYYGWAGEEQPGHKGLYNPRDLNGIGTKMYTAAYEAYKAAHRGGGLHTIPFPTYIDDGTNPRHQFLESVAKSLAATSVVTGVASFATVFFGPEVALPLKGASMTLEEAAAVLEGISAASGAGAAVYDCAKDRDAGCGLDVATLAIGGGGALLVQRVERVAEAAEEAGKIKSEEVELRVKYTEVATSNLENGFGVGSAANTFFNSHNEPEPEGLDVTTILVDKLDEGIYLKWQ